MAFLKANSSAVKRTGQRTLVAFFIILCLAGVAILTSSSNVMKRDIQAVNSADLELLDEVYKENGLASVVDLVDIASHRKLGAREVYGVFTPEGVFLSGDLKEEPDLTSSNEIYLIHAEGDSETAYLAQGQLYPDAVLYVGRPSQIVNRTLRNLMLILPLAFMAIMAAFFVFLKITAGTMGQLLGRIEDALTAFTGGDPTARIPLGPDFDDRFHDVSAGINANLDRVDRTTRVLENTTIAIAHDLRTPLTRASLAVQEVQTSGGFSEETENKLHLATLEMEKLRQTFDTILRISNITASDSDASFTIFDLSALAIDLIETYVPVFEDAGFELGQMAISEHPAMIQADKNMVAQLIINLLTNILRHCPAGTHAQLKITQTDDQTCLTICDTGPGVPVDKLDWIFAPFSRVDESRSAAGTGLGLALVKAIAIHNKSEITARLGTPGLVIDVTFPSAKARDLTKK